VKGKSALGEGTAHVTALADARHAKTAGGAGVTATATVPRAADSAGITGVPAVLPLAAFPEGRNLMPALTLEAVTAALADAGLPAMITDEWDRTEGIHVYTIPVAESDRVGLSFLPGPFAGQLGERAADVLNAAGYGAERVLETYGDYYVVFLGEF
jgi:hypothetical protein